MSEIECVLIQAFLWVGTMTIRFVDEPTPFDCE